ncbi:MAG TPA: alpha/beta hydrolase [Candidatus Dormibacteraeota bacterium]|nr:alpha/beta hydrolase [Candidatus Dormibacteraeota bacterium]
MGYAIADDGVRLHYEETGAGSAVLFVHEFAGDHRSWEPQVRELGRRHRCIAYDARGYAPSDVPSGPEQYSQARAVADAVAVLDHLGIERAHVVGLSIGGFCSLHLGLRHPDRALSLTVAGCGYGAQPDLRERWQAETEASAYLFEHEGAEATAELYMLGPARVQLQRKDPRAWEESKRWLAEHSAVGSALTLRGVQMRRPSLYDLTDELRRLRVPTLLVTGDEDEGCLDPNLMLKRTIPTAALAVLPQTGHACNLEEPAAFNRLVLDFIATVEAGRWEARDPRSLRASLTGMEPR